MNKKNKKEQTELSYYGLYLLNYLKENKFEQADDAAFIKGRADSAAETYERARLEGYPADGAQELAMAELLQGTASCMKSWRTSSPVRCRKRSAGRSWQGCCRLSAMSFPSMTFRTTISPSLPNTTCFIPN